MIHILHVKAKFCNKNLTITIKSQPPATQLDNIASNSDTIAIYLDTGSFLFCERQVNGKKVFAKS